MTAPDTSRRRCRFRWPVDELQQLVSPPKNRYERIRRISHQKGLCGRGDTPAEQEHLWYHRRTVPAAPDEFHMMRIEPSASHAHLVERVEAYGRQVSHAVLNIVIQRDADHANRPECPAVSGRKGTTQACHGALGPLVLAEAASRTREDVCAEFLAHAHPPRSKLDGIRGVLRRWCALLSAPDASPIRSSPHDLPKMLPIARAQQ